MLDFNYQGIRYAETLLKIARVNGTIKGLQMAAVRNRPQLFSRIQYLSQVHSFSNKNKTFISLGGIVLAILINLTILMYSRNEILKRTPLITSVHSINSNELLGNIIPLEKFEKRSIIFPSKVSENTSLIETPNEKEYNESIEGEALTYSFAAGIREEEIVPAKELIVNEEDSAGKKTSAYNVEFKDGEWIIQPLWIMSETKAKTDSLKNKADSLVKFFNSIQ